MFKIAIIVLLLNCTLYANLCNADVNTLRYNRPARLIARSQRQELSPTPYPAAGFRPEHQFPASDNQQVQPQPQQQRQLNAKDTAEAALPLQTNNLEQLARLELIYGAPINTPQQWQNLAAPKLIYGAPQAAIAAPLPAAQAERLTAVKSARLTAEREDQEDIDDTASAAEDVEVQSTPATPKAIPAQPALVPQSTVAYYPAGAASFVHPLATYTAAGLITTKLPTAHTTAYIPAPAASIYAPTAYYQPQFAYTATAAAPGHLRAW